MNAKFIIFQLRKLTAERRKTSPAPSKIFNFRTIKKSATLMRSTPLSAKKYRFARLPKKAPKHFFEHKNQTLNQFKINHTNGVKISSLREAGPTPTPLERASAARISAMICITFTPV